jgi:hypothetical protein
MFQITSAVPMKQIMVSVYISFFVNSFLIFKKCCVGIEAEVAEVIEEESPEKGDEGEDNEGVQDKGETDKMGTEDKGAEGKNEDEGVQFEPDTEAEEESSETTDDQARSTPRSGQTKKNMKKKATKKLKRGTKKQKLESDIENLSKEFEDHCQSSGKLLGLKLSLILLSNIPFFFI